MDEKYGFAPVPSVLDWGDLRLDLDLAWSFDRFNSLTRAEALDRLKEGFGKEFLDDFLFLPEEVFSYYFPALIELALELKTEELFSHQDFIREFFILVDARIFRSSGCPARWWPTLGPALKRLADAQAAFGFDVTIDENYGLRWAAWDQAAWAEGC